MLRNEDLFSYQTLDYHTRAGGSTPLWKTWIPAYAGMTTLGFYLILIPKGDNMHRARK